MASSSQEDRTIRLWNVTNLPKHVKRGRLLPQHTLEGHTEPVTAIAYSQDGKKLATASKNIRIWDLGQLNQVATFSGHSESVQSLAFSLDGTRLLSASETSVRQWDLVNKERLPEIVGKPTTTKWTSVAFGKTAPLAAALDSSLMNRRNLEVWDVSTGRLVFKLKSERDVVSALFSADGRFLVTASDDGSIALFNPADWSRTLMMRSLRKAPAAYVISRDGYVDFIGKQADLARRYPVCRIGPHKFPFQFCRERFEAKGLAAMLIGGNTSYQLP